MENAQYVITGWVLAGTVLTTYAVLVIRQTRQAERLLRREADVVGAVSADPDDRPQ